MEVPLYRTSTKEIMDLDGRNLFLAYFCDFYTRLKSLKFSFFLDVII